MRDLAKLKILEFSAIGWQYWLEPGVPTTFFFFFFFFFFF